MLWCYCPEDRLCWRCYRGRGGRPPAQLHWPMVGAQWLRQWPGQMRARFVWPRLPRSQRAHRSAARTAPVHSSSRLPAATVLPLNWTSARLSLGQPGLLCWQCVAFSLSLGTIFMHNDMTPLTLSHTTRVTDILRVRVGWIMSSKLP